MRTSIVLLGVLVLPTAFAVKTGDFKTCSQAGFCRRGRALADRALENAATWRSPYSVDAASVSVKKGEGAITAAVQSSLYPDITFALDVRVHADNVVRVRMDEVGGLRKRYDEAASWALIAEPAASSSVKWYVDKKEARASLAGEDEIVVTFSPLKVALVRARKEQVVLNGRGLLHMEHFRKKKEAAPVVEGDEQVVLEAEKNPRAWFEGEEEDAFWEETFSSWTDSKPKGPESLSMDILFPRHGHVYGIPQHATALDLPATRGPNAKYTDPYRLWNSDVFEYAADSTMSLYGSIPLLHAHSDESTVAVFNALASDTFVDVEHPTDGSTHTHWIAESGVLDTFILPGPTPAAVFAQYAALTGAAAMPAHWALGYHQCRWNYLSSDDVRTVQRRFDEEDIPVDVFWLDIDYSPDHKYFMWKDKEFPDPVEMVNDVAANGRKMVVIIDPHLKRADDFAPYKEASELDVLVKPASGQGEYEGWCWPGSSSWVDFFNPKSWAWWQGVFRTTEEKTFTWTKSTKDVHIWNDMNEPSVFNGPEISMPRDNVHHGGWEHRDVHNINGMLFTNQTYKGVLARSGGEERPFVLTRSFYAGSQRFGAMWTGDNLGTWEHMAVGIKMVLANGIAGMTFAGSDVGGFFGNPDPEMLVRWYQVGAFNPFFRAHAHIDTKRREPFLLEEPYRGMVKETIRLRYALMPVWYTAFREASVNGMPVLRPHYVMFPKDTKGFAIDDQYFVGDSGLLVKPITEKGLLETSMYLPEEQIYYDYISYRTYHGTKEGRNVTVSGTLDRVPLLIRGGSVVPTRDRPRRSVSLMARDPVTLRVALDNAGASARGELYLDDGASYAYQRGAFVWREFAAARAGKNGKGALRLTSRDLAARNLKTAVDTALSKYDAGNEYAQSVKDVSVGKIVVLGLPEAPKSVRVEGGKELVWEYAKGAAATDRTETTRMAALLTIKGEGLGVAQDWAIVIE